jgi:hypothetical protein
MGERAISSSSTHTNATPVLGSAQPSNVTATEGLGSVAAVIEIVG